MTPKIYLLSDSIIVFVSITMSIMMGQSGSHLEKTHNSMTEYDDIDDDFQWKRDVVIYRNYYYFSWNFRNSWTIACT